MRAFVRDEAHRPLATAEVRAVIRGPDGRKWPRELKSVGGGEYAGAFPAEEPGAYRVTVQALDRRKRLGQDEGVLQVGSPWEEARDMSTDFPSLRLLAQAGGGESVPLDDYSYGWLEKKLESAAWTTGTREALWNSPWVLAALVALMFAEWVWRRRRGDV